MQPPPPFPTLSCCVQHVSLPGCRVGGWPPLPARSGHRSNSAAAQHAASSAPGSALRLLERLPAYCGNLQLQPTCPHHGAQ